MKLLEVFGENLVFAPYAFDLDCLLLVVSLQALQDVLLLMEFILQIRQCLVVQALLVAQLQLLSQLLLHLELGAQLCIVLLEVSNDFVL